MPHLPAPGWIPADAVSGGVSVYLHPGHLHVSLVPCTMTTILGSCVAVCLWDPVSRVGGMNHFLLAHHPPAEIDSARYGDSATDMLISAAARAGGSLGRLQAKLFGGACVLGKVAAGTQHLGLKNVMVARERLAAHGIRVVGEDVEGPRGRKIHFQTLDGVVLVRTL